MTTQLLIALVILSNLLLLGSSRVLAMIRAVAAQALFLCALVVFEQKERFGSYEWVLVSLTIVVKCFVLPRMMRHAFRETTMRRDLNPLIGYSSSLFLGLILLGLCLHGAHRLPLPEGAANSMVVATTFFTIGVGLLLVVTRSKAITQVIGYLSMENGIYALGLAVAAGSPLIVEMGILLDVLVGIFVMGIFILHINREFDHIDTQHLSSLKD